MFLLPSAIGAIQQDPLRRIFKQASLDLQFAEKKSLVDATTGQNLVTFTRASSGTYVGSDGLIKTATTNEARFDHGPTTGESLGLLVEESRTNLLLRSEALNAAPWTANSGGSGTTITADYGIAPDGNATADLVTFNLQNGSREQAVTSIEGVTYTLSFYAKRISGNYNLQFLHFNSATGVSTNLAVTDSWKRYSVSFLGRTGGGTIVVGIRDNNASGWGSTLVWGAQLEAGAFPTSYIHTTTATVTRSADVASISGSNFSGWFNATEGTVFSGYKGVANIEGSSTRRVVEIGVSGAITNRMILGYNSTAFSRFFVVASSSTQADQSVSTTQGNQVSNAAAYKIDDFIIASNSVLSAGDTSGIVPTVSAMAIGNDFSSGSALSLNGTIRRLAYWPQRLPNETLQTVTQ